MTTQTQDVAIIEDLDVQSKAAAASNTWPAIPKEVVQRGGMTPFNGQLPEYTRRLLWLIGKVEQNPKYKHLSRDQKHFIALFSAVKHTTDKMGLGPK